MISKHSVTTFITKFMKNRTPQTHIYTI